MHIFWFNGKQITILPLSFVLQCWIYYYGRKSNIHVSLFYLDEKGSVRVILKLCMKETIKRFSCKRLSDSKACSNFILGGSDKNNSRCICPNFLWSIELSAFIRFGMSLYMHAMCISSSVFLCSSNSTVWSNLYSLFSPFSIVSLCRFHIFLQLIYFTLWLFVCC